MPKKIDWENIKKAYLEESETYASLALRFGVGKSTIEARASAEGWVALKESRVTGVAPQKPQNMKIHPRGEWVHRNLDEVEILENAIQSLSGYFSGGLEDTRGLGSLATGLCKLIELRNKLVPKNAADLADMAIALDISPEEFIRQLSERWRERA
ncbi:hypothetical protein NIES4101_53860 [Calothrix sp. NIES-4101]|nr:hypothetical protein NIES4101_53860 [Calothrix sp. NIES-4101]